MSEKPVVRTVTRASVSGVTLRLVTAEDAAFLFELYASTRQEELDAMGWSPEQRAAFLRMQFTAQQAGYRTMFPEARFQIILRDGERIGWQVINRTSEEMRIVHLALMPAHRRGGIGTDLLTQILVEAIQADRPVRLHVLKHNPALRLYARCGFRKTGESDGYEMMEWTGADYDVPGG